MIQVRPLCLGLSNVDTGCHSPTRSLLPPLPKGEGNCTPRKRRAVLSRVARPIYVFLIDPVHLDKVRRAPIEPPPLAGERSNPRILH